MAENLPNKLLNKNFKYSLSIEDGEQTEATIIVISSNEPEIKNGEVWGDLDPVTFKVTLKLKTINGWQIISPETLITNIVGIDEIFNEKLDKNFKNYSSKENIALTDTIVLNDSEDAEAVKYIKVGQILNYSYKGFYMTEAALNLAFPEGQAGWHAIIGFTDTVFIWDVETSAWKNSFTSSFILSVNGQTGHVIIETPGTLNTNNTDSLPTSENESLSGLVNLHKVSKTGSYNDMKDKPTISKFFVQLAEPMTAVIGDFWLNTTT